MRFSDSSTTAVSITLTLIGITGASAQLLPPVGLTPEPGVTEMGFGRAVAVSGGHLLVGAPVNGDGGSVSVYNADTLDVRFVLRPASALPVAGFGSDFDVLGDLALIGAEGSQQEGTLGAAFLFDLSTGEQLAELRSAMTEAEDRFGASVAIGDGVALVAAPRENENARNAGRVYVFDLSNPGAPIEADRLQPSQIEHYAGFGTAMAIDGSTAAISEIGGGDSGRVHLYRLTDPTDPVRLAEIEPPVEGALEQFGWSIDFDDRRLLIGAYGPAAMLYEVQFASDPIFRSTLAVPDPASAADFGVTVALSGDTAVVAQSEDSLDALRAGSVHVFNVSDISDPLFTDRLTRPVPRDGDYLGYGAAIDGTTVVAGTYFDAVGAPQGLALVWDLNGACSAADLSLPAGVLDLADVVAFVDAFDSGDLAADLDGNGLLDLADVTAFADAFVLGCPG